MPIYVRPSGNDANGGTNDFGDALQTLVAAVAKFDRTNADKRDIILCADVVGGTANFGGSSNRFFNNNESLWQYGTSEAQRMSIKGRVGDDITFTPFNGASYWFLFKDKFQYFTLDNFTIDAINKTTAGDSVIKCFSNNSSSPDQVELIFNELSILNEHTDGMKLGTLMNGWSVTNCLFKDFGRVGSNNQGLYGEGRNGLIQGNVAYKTGGNQNSTGLRCYTNHLSMLNDGYPESANNVFDGNLVYDVQTGLAWAGNNITVMNNYIVEVLNLGLDLILQGAGTNDGHKVLNNSGKGRSAGDTGFAILNSTSPHDNLEIQNNIFWNYTTPINLNSGSATVNSDNLTASDPLFTDVANNDLSIPTNSPAKNNGVTRAEVTRDYVGTLRPQGVAYCQGAFEFVEETIYGSSRDRIVNVGSLSSTRRYFFMGR